MAVPDESHRGDSRCLRDLALIGLYCLFTILGGCGEITQPPLAPLFTVPLSIEGEPVGAAIIDTGGAYEVMLREDFGLAIVDSVEVLAFGGTRIVPATEGFAYSAGGIHTTAESAILSTSICDCNGLGFNFFRKTGMVLGLDFAAPGAAFLAGTPAEGVTIEFAPPPGQLPTFDSSFIQVDVSANGLSRQVTALLDTGANVTAVRRDLFYPSRSVMVDRLRVEIAHESLGTVRADVTLFDTPGLPDIILGTDLMGAWGDRWFFHFTAAGGTVTVVSTPPAVLASG